MGNITELATELEGANGALQSALTTLSAVTKKVGEKVAELEERDARLERKEGEMKARGKELEEKENNWRKEERRMKRKEREWEEKRARWEEAEARMAANAAKLKNQIVLNIGGEKFLTTKATLLQHKGSYLEEMLLSDSLQSENGEFFIDQDPRYFKVILNFLRNGRLRNEDLLTADMTDLKAEFQFYKVQFPEIDEADNKSPTSTVLPAAASVTSTYNPLTFSPPTNLATVFPPINSTAKTATLPHLTISTTKTSPTTSATFPPPIIPTTASTTTSPTFIAKTSPNTSTTFPIVSATKSSTTTPPISPPPATASPNSPPPASTKAAPTIFSFAPLPINASSLSPNNINNFPVPSPKPVVQKKQPPSTPFASVPAKDKQ